MPKATGPAQVTRAEGPPLPRWLRGWGSQSRGNNVGVVWLTRRRVQAGEAREAPYRVRGSEELKARWREKDDHQHPANPRLSLPLLPLETQPLTYLLHPVPGWKGRAFRCTEHAPHCLFPSSAP